VRELWAYRELLFFLVWRDLKSRYKQTALGIAWAVIQPVASMIVFTLFFGRAAGLEATSSVPYPVFVYAGLLAWIYFANAITNGANGLINNAQLVTKVYFPREILTSVPLVSTAFDFVLAFGVLLLLMLGYGVSLTPSLLLVFPLLLGVAALGLGVSFFLGALNVRYRDIRHAVPFVVQLWLFASPVIYPPSFLPERYRVLLDLNPMTGHLLAIRGAILGETIDLRALGLAWALSLMILAVGYAYFRSVEATMADVI